VEDIMKERLIIKITYESAAIIAGTIILGALAVLYALGAFGGYPASTLNRALHLERMTDESINVRDLDRKWSPYQERRQERITVVEIDRKGKRVELK
jgi:hypothetical protein